MRRSGNPSIALHGPIWRACGNQKPVRSTCARCVFGFLDNRRDSDRIRRRSYPTSMRGGFGGEPTAEGGREHPPRFAEQLFPRSPTDHHRPPPERPSRPHTHARTIRPCITPAQYAHALRPHIETRRVCASRAYARRGARPPPPRACVLPVRTRASVANGLVHDGYANIDLIRRPSEVGRIGFLGLPCGSQKKNRAGRGMRSIRPPDVRFRCPRRSGSGFQSSNSSASLRDSSSTRSRAR